MTTDDAFETALNSLVDSDGLPRFAHRLVLVVGVGRSGTTVLRRALGEHPQLLRTRHEAPLERAVATGFGNHLTQSREFQDYVRRTSVASWNNVEASFRRIIFEASVGDESGRLLLRENFDAGAHLPDIAGWTAKMGAIWRPSAAGLAALFSGLQTVYIHRNGMDAVQSRTRFGTFADQEFETHCTKWAAGLGYLDVLKAETDVTVVRHQDLVDRPVEFFANLLGDLGLNDDPSPAAHAMGNTANPTQELDADRTIAENFNSRPEAHLDWSEDQRRTFITICGKAMATYGYDIPFA